MNRPLGKIILSVFVLLVAHVSLRAQVVVPVTNFNFETGGFAGDAQFSNNPVVVPTGWTVFSSLSGNFSGYFNPTVNDYVGAAGNSGVAGSMDGPNIFYFGAAVAGEGIEQTLAESFTANTSYALTVALGARLSAPAGGLTMTLLAGSTTLATATVHNAVAGSFSDFTLNYSFNAADSSLLGQALTIQFTDSRVPNSGEVDIDNVRLLATTAVPEPATWLLFALGVLGLIGLRARSALSGQAQRSRLDS